jgi:hypothetical protein
MNLELCFATYGRARSTEPAFDSSRGAHVEPTIAITEDGPRILTTQLAA